MNTTFRSELEYPKLPVGPRIAAAFAAAVVSASLIGSVLGLFDRQSHDAILARTATPASPTAVVDSSIDTPGDATRTRSPKRG